MGVPIESLGYLLTNPQNPMRRPEEEVARDISSPL